MPPHTTKIQRTLDEMVSEGLTGVEATISIDGDVTQMVAGVGNRRTEAPYPRDARVRIASVTKPFTSALVMLLVGAGEVDLDAPIERYLPGLLHGPGIDPEAITVRQILQHRSGLPEYAEEPEVTRPRSTNHPRTFTPHDLIELALRHPAQFPPGTKMVYTGTNFVVAGMLVEKVTGTTLSTALRDRLAEPLGLEETYLPNPGDRSLPRPHPHGYETAAGRTTDVTGLEPSGPWAAGGMVSTGADLDRFLTALVQGDIIAPAELREMQRTVPMGLPGVRYGLGLMRIRLSCDVVAWGHAGDVPGFMTMAGATADGTRAATFVMNEMPNEFADPQHFRELLSLALC